MSVVHRRTFIAKVGKADELVKLLKDEDKQMRQMGFTMKSRILTDYLSGRTDRVVHEMEAESLGEIEGSFTTAMNDAKARKFFEDFFSKLTPIIHHAEVDNLRTQ
jgi:hypothetical protein